MSVDPDYYALLGVPSTASFEEIRRAYRKCAFVAHPDHGGSTSKMLLLNEAWEVLRHGERRADYDALRAASQRGARGGGGVSQPRAGQRRTPAKRVAPAKARSFAQMAGSFVGSAFRAITGTGKSAAPPKPARPRRAHIVACGHCGQKLRIKPNAAANIVCPKCRHAQPAP